MCRVVLVAVGIQLWISGFTTHAQTTQTPAVDANRSISIAVEQDRLTVTTTNRLAGAVHSIRWQGQEFIDSADHGRQLQSASSFDALSDDPFWAERYNPTEAGSRRDGVGDRSTSRLLGIKVHENQLSTSTQMAFWLSPGETSDGRPALNQTALSDHILHKSIRLGVYHDPRVIQVSNSFQWPREERHRYAQFEVLTGYMPAVFSQFWRVSNGTGELERLDDGPGEQPDPVILSTADKRFAMGAIADGKPDWIEGNPGYGRFRFTKENVVKWNVVFRHREMPFIQHQQASFRVLVMVGSLELVHRLIQDAMNGRLTEVPYPKRD